MKTIIYKLNKLPYTSKQNTSLFTSVIIAWFSLIEIDVA